MRPGWLEGGLSVSYEKLITDLEAVQTIAELCQPTSGDEASIAYAALEDVQPGGHFFATQHTMDRYRQAFYQPLVADLSNFGTWTEAGGKTATERANGIWKRVLQDFVPPISTEGISDRLEPFIRRRVADGGAEPVS